MTRKDALDERLDDLEDAVGRDDELELTIVHHSVATDGRIRGCIGYIASGSSEQFATPRAPPAAKVREHATDPPPGLERQLADVDGPLTLDDVVALEDLVFPADVRDEWCAVGWIRDGEVVPDAPVFADSSTSAGDETGDECP